MANEQFDRKILKDAISAPTCPQPDQIQEERLKFDAKFLESSGHKMYAFVRRNLRTFHLDRIYREAFVLNEAYLRGVKQINEGKVIRNVTPWLKATTYNIIRELSRERKKSASREESITEIEQPLISPEELEDDLARVRVRMAFNLLDPKDQQLLNLKVVEGHSWKEIRKILRLEGWEDLTEEVLRKRKERILTKLRKNYHTLSRSEFTE